MHTPQCRTVKARTDAGPPYTIETENTLTGTRQHRKATPYDSLDAARESAVRQASGTRTFVRFNVLDRRGNVIETFPGGASGHDTVRETVREFVDPALIEAFAADVDALREAKGITTDQAFDMIAKPAWFRSYRGQRPEDKIDLENRIINKAKSIGRARSRVHETPRHVADFNTLDDLISHAARDLGATHTSGSEANTKLYFPRGGQYPYEEATVWRKNGYWHAQGPSARTGIARLPSDARSIGGSGQRRAAEAPRSEGIMVAVRLDDPRFGSGPAVVVSYPESVLEYNKMITDRDGARDPRMRLWRTRNRVPIGTRISAGLVPGTGIAVLRPEESRGGSRTVRDYIAVDRRGRTIAGPFKTYGPAKDAAGTAGTVQYVRAGVGEAKRAPRRGVPDPLEQARAAGHPFPWPAELGGGVAKTR